MNKKMIIIGVAGLLLIGGGAGGYFYFINSAEASLTEEGKAEAEKAEKEKDDGHGEKSGVEFVQLDPLILPIIDNEGVQQTVNLVVSLEVEGAGSADKVKKMQPRLKDAYIQDMYGSLNKNIALKDGVIQVGVIKDRLNKVTDKIMEDPDVVHDVLLQVVQQRPI